MARLGRYFLPDQPLHVIQRGNNREAIFFAEADYDDYRGWLADAAAAYGAIHAYVLMTNHVHLLVTPRRADSLPRTMQSLGRRYVRHINATYRRTGTLWEGRYRGKRGHEVNGDRPRFLVKEEVDGDCPCFSNDFASAE